MSGQLKYNWDHKWRRALSWKSEWIYLGNQQCSLQVTNEMHAWVYAENKNGISAIGSQHANIEISISFQDSNSLAHSEIMNPNVWKM